MKRLVHLLAFFVLLFTGSFLYAQSPSAIPYQAVARNSSGNLIANQNVSLRFSIRDASATGTVVYRETHSVTTNALGLFVVNIGQGTPVSGTFGSISWGAGAKFMQVEMDAAGGTSYIDMGTQQMLSVPYALYANSGGTPPVAGTGISVSGNTVTNTAPDQPVSLTGSGATTITGTYPNFTVTSTDANTTYTGGTGINVTGTTITNTAPDQPVSLTGSGATTVTGTYPNFTVSSTDANTTYTGGTGINVTGITITNTAPDQPVSLTGSGATTITGTYPNFTVSSTDANTTYTGGTGINVTGTTITNTAPDQPVSLTGSGATTITGTYPNFTVSSTDANTTYTGGTGINVTGTTITNTAPDQTVALTGGGITTVTGTYPDFTVTSAETDPQVSAVTTNRVPKWNGTTLTDGTITDNGNIGIGITSPSSALHVYGASESTVLRIENGSGNAYTRLFAGASGSEAGLGLYTTGSQRWSFGKSNTVESGSDTGSDFFINRYSDAGSYLGQPFVIKRATGNVGIGTSSPSEKLEVAGKTKTTNFQMTDGAANGYVLQSDANGNAGWVDPNTLYTVIDTLLHVTGSNGTVAAGSEELGLIQMCFVLQNVVITQSTKMTFTFDITCADMSTTTIQLGDETIYDGSVSGANFENTTFSPTADSPITAASAPYTGTFTTTTSFSSLYGDYTELPEVICGYIITDQSNGSGFTLHSVHITFSEEVSRPAENNLNLNENWISGDGDDEGIFVNDAGNVGIGTTSVTQARLVVNGSQSANIGSHGYLGNTGNTGAGSGTHSYSIYATDRIAGAEFNAFSDARIKNILGLSDSHADLQTLMGIEITDYKLKDHIAKGDQTYKKVIAQQIEEVYPQAVSKMTDVVPDIYQLADIREGRVAIANTLKAGEKVKLIFGARTEVVEIMAADAQGFNVNLPDEGKVFVYGREVDDFRTVDYEALSTLNISATQELVKRIQSLEAKNSTLEQGLSKLQTENQAMKSDIEQIKAALQVGAQAGNR